MKACAMRMCVGANRRWSWGNFWRSTLPLSWPRGSGPLSGWSSPPTTRSRSVKPTVHSFVTQGCSEVAAKLAVIEDHLKPISVYQTTPSTPRQACSSHISTWLWLFLKSVMRIQIVGWWHCLSTPLLYASLSLWCSPSQSAPTAPLAAMSLTR